MRLSDFVGQEEARLGLLLNAVDPRCGGLLLAGGRGCGKSTLARFYRRVITPGAPFIELPLNATEESLLGGIDLEKTLESGKRCLQPGILSRAHGGAVFVDDINLLSPELTALLMEPRDRGTELIEREGFSGRRECVFTVIATMNPEEGELSPHLADRFGLCAVMEDLSGPEEHLAVLRAALKSDGPKGDQADPDAVRVCRARRLLPSITFSPEAVERIAEIAQQTSAQGHRAELFHYHASRACAALEGTVRVGLSHVERTAGLPYVHRRLLPGEDAPPPSSDQQQTEDGHADNGEARQGNRDRDGGGNSPEPGNEGEGDCSGSPRESSNREEVQPTGRTFAVRHIALRKDRMKRKASGRRTATRTMGRCGRCVKTLTRSADMDVALDATLRACAPFQGARGRTDRLLIEQQDLRFRQRERKTGHLALFVVDGSGSMGARQRMSEVKGAVQSLLLDCYRKRDRVAMIVFRKDRAELVLPPTRSVELAAKRLAHLPVGGKTPLTAGLLEARRLVERTLRNRPDTRILVVLLTDGRANHSMSGAPAREESLRMARLMRNEGRCDYIVVDTENKGNLIRTDLARTLAETLGARYFTFETLRAEGITALARIYNPSRDDTNGLHIVKYHDI